VGTGAATEFLAFLRMFRELPNTDAILLNPTREPVPENAAAQYAVASALAHCASDMNLDRICLYLNRLPPSFERYARATPPSASPPSGRPPASSNSP
jgi:hypothetical protein